MLGREEFLAFCFGELSRHAGRNMGMRRAIPADDSTGDESLRP
jgi:hypothetical protein